MITNWPDILKQIMIEKKFDTHKLAGKTGLTLHAITLFLRGRSEMKFDRFEACLNALGYELDAFPKEQNCSGARRSTRDHPRLN